MSATVYYVTNRPNEAGRFGPTTGFPASYDLLSYGTATLTPSPDPAHEGILLGATLTRAVIADTTPDSGLVSFLQTAFNAAQQAGATPMLMVHGYSYTFAEALVRTADFVAWIASAPQPVQLLPILFTWPSIDGLSSENYREDRDRAQSSSYTVACFLRAFAAAWSGAGKPRTVYLAHSMGGWVSQNSFRTLASMAPPIEGPLFDQAVIMAGDADVDALEPGHGLDELARLSNWLTIGVNATDFATGVTAHDILGINRLASSGPLHPDLVPANTRIVDYTLAVAADSFVPPGQTGWNYMTHQYYHTNAHVRDDLAAILAGFPPEAIGQRMCSADMLACGQVAIQPDRWYLSGFAADRPVMVADIDNPDRRGA